jgi:hypothetical protein
LRIDLAPGFSGPVKIGCGAANSDLHTIPINSTGQTDGASCPRHQVDLLIMRDGKRIFADGPIKWDYTGDGIAVGIHFTVR